MYKRNEKPITVHTAGRFATWIYRSNGRRFCKYGRHVIYSYNESKSISILDAIYRTRHLVNQYRGKLDVVYIGSYKSIFDKNDMPRLKLHLICRELSKSDFHTIAFEADSRDIRYEVLDSIKRWLPDKDIIIKVGLWFGYLNGMPIESGDRTIALNNLEYAVDRIHARGLKAGLSVPLEIPGTSEKDQIRNCIELVYRALYYGADEVTIFPMNVKPFTKLDDSKYDSPSLWALVEVLNALDSMDTLDDRFLSRVNLSWFGDRQPQEIPTDIIPPYTCDQCRPDLINFCKEWNRYSDIEDFGIRRRSLLKAINNKHACSCHDRVRKLMEEPRPWRKRTKRQ